MTAKTMDAKTTDAAAAAVTPTRRPALGGFSATFLVMEIRRMLRNRRTLVFVLVMPPLFFLLFGGANRGQHLDNGTRVNAYIMISLAVYGAMVATTSGGAMVAVERAQGWSRQLRLTPLHPAAYVATKVLTAMALGLLAVVIQFTVGAVSDVRMPAHVWLFAGLAAWLGSLVFAAFGLFVGYLAPAENVMQFLGPILAILALFGGLFVPLEVLPHVMQQIAKFTPVYGVGQIARSWLIGESVSGAAVANVVLWTAGFGFGAARLFRRDTARV
ncbi:ABC transporter permease [Rhizomonospora bruguierae]|uniref:ABC transporter permease n=1 Tax=Rhizomonospora bruguierae TaxID=1581705 RepID=UPI0020C07262|nr:ABC transporter permease [Micromonospora sp. NBRC 107566]